MNKFLYTFCFISIFTINLFATINNDFGYIIDSYVVSLENGCRMLEMGKGNIFTATRRIKNILDARDNKTKKISYIDMNGNHISGPVWSSIKFSFFRIDLDKYFKFFNNKKDNSLSYSIKELLCRYDKNKFIVKYYMKKNEKLIEDTMIITIDSLYNKVVLTLYSNKNYFKKNKLIESVEINPDDTILKRYNYAYPMILHTGLIVRSLVYFLKIADSFNYWHIINDSLYGDFSRDTIIKAIKEAISFHEDQWNSDVKIYTIRKNIHKNLLPRIGDYVKNNTHISIPWNMNFTLAHAISRIHLFQLTDNFNNCKWINRDAELIKTFFNNRALSGLKIRNNYYIWKYHSDSTNTRLSDIVHGYYDVNFFHTFYSAHKNQNIISYKDMQYFTNTLLFFFNKKIRYTDYDKNPFAYDCYNFMDIQNLNRLSIDAYRGAKWSFLTQFNPKVYEISYNIYKYKHKSLFSYILKYYKDWLPWNISILSVNDSIYAIKLKHINTIGDIMMQIKFGNSKQTKYIYIKNRESIFDTILFIKTHSLKNTEIIIQTIDNTNNIKRIGPNKKYFIK